MAVKRMKVDFLQVMTDGGPNGTVLGMKFRNEMDTSNFSALLEQCTASGYHQSYK